MLLMMLSGALGAALFGTAGWCGRMLAETRYASLEREADGPLPVALPAWLFVAVPAGLGTVVGLHGVQPVTLALLVIAVLSLTVCAATDLRSGLLPDLFTIGPLVDRCRGKLLRQAVRPRLPLARRLVVCACCRSPRSRPSRAGEVWAGEM